jgi:tRNA(fMet)-specific endonuclease VapC
MLYALDTNTIAYFFRGEGNVAERVLAHAPSDIAVPSVVEYEVRYGLAKARRTADRRLNQLQDLLKWTVALPFGAEEAAAAAEIRASLERKGRAIGRYDVLIAGTAMANRATLVTHNTGEFGRIQGLSLEDWY